MKKIIFSDFDNTLLNYNDGDTLFDDYRIGILRKIKDKRIKLGIVTGRTVVFFNQFPELLEVVDYVMGSNGACVYDVRNNKYIYQDVIEEDTFKSIVDWSCKYNHSFLINCLDKKYYMDVKKRFEVFDINDSNVYNNEIEYICDQIILSVDRDVEKDVFSYLDNYSDMKVNNVSYATGYCNIDICNSTVSKGNAVKWLCDYLDIDKKDTIAFGDGVNDRSMFEVVDKSVAMGNAIESLKVVANDIALDCSCNGFYKYIEDNILK